MFHINLQNYFFLRGLLFGNIKSDNLAKMEKNRETETPLHLAVMTAFRVHEKCDHGG